MKKYIYISLMTLTLLFGCADQLDVKDPNRPTAASLTTESNITLYALAVYYTGYRGLKYGGFQGQYLNDVWSYHEIMGDVIGVEAANVYINQLGMPNSVTWDNATVVNNPSTPNTQLGLIRFVNQNSFASANTLYYEWAYSYQLNNHCNAILANVDNISFGGDADSRRNTLKAWAHWWKGIAYSRIGSMYYAGVINDKVGATNGNYVSSADMIAEAQANFDEAATLLDAVTVVADYNKVMASVIPSFIQTGKGAVPTIAMWKRNINTMKARNILVNTKASAMTPTQWSDVLTLTNNGILSTDNIFIGKSNATGDFMSATGGTVALVAAGDPSAVTFKISERLIQEYKAGDKRLNNNFTGAAGGAWIGNADRGNSFNTRWALRNVTTGVGPEGAGVVVYANRTAGSTASDAYLAGSYEENELMKAEAKIYTNDIEGGLAHIDAIRTFQGAGLAAVTGTGLTLAQAKEELRRERRVGLVFRALSFYDARRWGVIDPISSGGGRTGAVIISKVGANPTVVNTNATIDYNFLDYWDVPDNELVFNPPSGTSAPVKNPRTN